MTDHSETEPVLRQVLWSDAILEAVTVDYDEVVLRIQESTGLKKSLHCEGHIGLDLNGFWDEVTIERAELVTEHPLIARLANNISRRLGNHWPDTGNEHRNTRCWSALIVHLSDGCSLVVVAASFAIR